MLRDILKNYGTDYSQQWLDHSKEAMLRTMNGALETPNAQLNMLRTIVLFGLPDDYVKQRENTLKTFTLDQAKTVIGKYLNFDDMTVVVVGDAKTQLEGVKSLGLGDPVLVDFSADGRSGKRSFQTTAVPIAETACRFRNPGSIPDRKTFAVVHLFLQFIDHRHGIVLYRYPALSGNATDQVVLAQPEFSGAFARNEVGGRTEKDPIQLLFRDQVRIVDLGQSLDARSERFRTPGPSRTPGATYRFRPRRRSATDGRRLLHA